MITLNKTNHVGLCNAEHSEHLEIFDTWEDFLDVFPYKGNIDTDWNYLIRYDIENLKGSYVLKLFYLQQYKGRFVPVIVKNIKEEDLESINNYLRKCLEYIKKLWKEFN